MDESSLSKMDKKITSDVRFKLYVQNWFDSLEHDYRMELYWSGRIPKIVKELKKEWEQQEKQFGDSS